LHRTRFQKERKNPEVGFLRISLFSASLDLSQQSKRAQTVKKMMFGGESYANAKCLMLLVSLSATVKDNSFLHSRSRNAPKASKYSAMSEQLILSCSQLIYFAATYRAYAKLTCDSLRFASRISHLLAH
jgi:hypothetical protein